MNETIQNRFELVERVAEGPRGEVWRALDHGATLIFGGEREVWLKRLAAGVTPRGWEDLQLRTGLVGHPGLPGVVSVGFDSDERAFLVTRHRAGSELGGFLARCGDPGIGLQEAITVAVMVCEALARCHRLGVLHLNLKPGNLLLAEDFLGVAPVLADPGLGVWAPDAAWAAPELLGERGSAAGTVRSDVYGVGLLLLAMLTGRRPDGGPLVERVSAAERLARGDGWAEALHLQVLGVPDAVRETLTRAIHPEVSQRHRSLAELRQQLRSGLYASAGAMVVGPAGAGDAGSWASVPGVRSGVGLSDAVVEEVEHVKEGRELIRFHLRHRGEDGRWGTSGGFAFKGEVGEGGPLFVGMQHAWVGASVHISDATLVPKGGLSYTTDSPRTLAVLEPYFPIAVSSVVSGEGCGTRYLTDLRGSGGSNRNLVVGRIVHAMMEAMVIPPTPDREDKRPRGLGFGAQRQQTPEEQFEVLFEEVAREHRLELLGAGLGEADVGAVRDQARLHFLNLAAFARQDGLSAFSGAFTEVTRYSSTFGMEGRIDLAFDDGQVFRILELKTGKAWKDHARQVHCYALLWEGVARGLGRRVHGELLYSRTGRTQSVDGGDRAVRRRILESRNAIVTLHRSLAFGDTSYEAPAWLHDPEACYSAACNFRRKRCEHQSQVLGMGVWGAPELLAEAEHPWAGVDPELVQLARAWHRRMTRYVEAEYWVDNVRMGQILRAEALEERAEAMDAVPGLELTSVNVRLGRVTLRGAGLHFLSAGQEVILHRGDPQGGHLLRGRVWGVVSDTVTVASSAAAAAQTLPTDGWVVELPPARIGLRTSHQALFDALRSRDLPRLEVLLRRRVIAPPPPLAPDRSRDAALSRLNAGQREAVEEALRDHAALLIQGPPGTGKTTVIAEIIEQLVAQGRRVVLGAGTNTAVDNVLIRLVERGFTRFVRLGSAAGSNELSAAMRRRGIDPAQRFAKELQREAPDLDALDDALRHSPVIAGTTHRLVSSPVIELLERHQGHLRGEHNALPRLFDVAILDEAGQITEPLALGAINRAGRFILVGDHQQLPPVVIADVALSAFQEAAADLCEPPAPADRSPQAWDRRILTDAGVRGLDQSLFERLAGHVPHVRLTTQYRMNAVIMGYSSAAFYDDQLEADPAVQALGLPIDPDALAQLGYPLADLLNPATPLVLADLQGRERGRQNRDEAALILDLLRALLQPGLLQPRAGARPFDPARAADEIGVISPFRAQVQLLRRLAREAFGDAARGLQIDTVERFQGGEREIILVSTVASERVSAHLADPRRLNVTLTRAKSKLVLVGNLDTLAQTSLLYQRLLERPGVCVVPIQRAAPEACYTPFPLDGEAPW